MTILDAKTESDLHRKLGIVMGISSMLIHEVEDSFPNQKKALSHITMKVNRGFSNQDLSGQWATYITHIDEQTIIYLELLADLLETKNRNELLSNEQITQVIESLRNTCNEVLESDIDFDLKKYVLRKLRTLISSIEDYQLTGIDSILDSLDSSIGHVHTNQEYRDFIQNTDLGKKVIEVLGMTANIVTVVAGVPQIGNSFQLLLDS